MSARAYIYTHVQTVFLYTAFVFSAPVAQSIIELAYGSLHLDILNSKSLFSQIFPDCREADVDGKHVLSISFRQ